MTQKAPEFLSRLRAGSTITLGSRSVRLERRVLGELEFTDGRVVACDPLVPMDIEPFCRVVRPGFCEVVMFVAPGEPDENIAVELVFSQTPTATWQVALRSEHDESGAYGVDSGVGAFMTAGVAEQLELGEHVHEAVGTRVIAMLDETPHGAIVRSANVTLAAFRSGIGDGIYESWWGLDAHGIPTRLVTDFGLAEEA